MRCIICKQASTSSRSVEHIIPESLGNTDHVLPPGVVCDGCNNYIARKIEKPLLDSVYFRERRFKADLPNKKKRIPSLDGVHMQSLTHIQLFKNFKDSAISIGAAPNADEAPWVHSLLNQKSGTLILPIGIKPDDYIVSRFIAKVGLEVLAFRLLNVPGGLDEIIDEPKIEKLRQYIRMGSPGKIWPYSFRSIYAPESIFHSGSESYEVLHEFDILKTMQNEFYIVVVIFGYEYALNLGGREIDGYKRWLHTNKGKSPLYTGKNAK